MFFFFLSVSTLGHIIRNEEVKV